MSGDLLEQLVARVPTEEGQALFRKIGKTTAASWNDHACDHVDLPGGLEVGRPLPLDDGILDASGLARLYEG